MTSPTPTEATGSEPTSEPVANALIGVDVGGSGVKAALVDLDTGQATGRIRVDTPQPATPDAIATSVAGLVSQLAKAGPVGCTMPAVVKNGMVHSASHIDKSWIDADAASAFGHAIGRPCVVLNDADAAGLAEARFGAARGHDGIVVLVTVGTGVGTALLNAGTLVPNAELGHIFVEDHLVDDWVSDATRVAEDLPWKRWTSRLDRYLVQLQEIVTADLIVIGGGIVKHADKFLDRLDPGCEVRVAKLGNLAGIVGAALRAAEPAPH